ncbi:MAG TPA: MoaD/ThiS family protein [Thermohalobaculum sp.]|nr:MoaD/ThiS family protein [Thermohalobaculum sp.]
MTAPVVTVHLAGALRELFPGVPREVAVEAETVAEMLDRLEARWPGMRDRLCDGRPSVRRHINIFVDGGRAVLGTPLEAGCEVYVFTALSGG